MYNRMAEISELKKKIESFYFGDDLSKYKHLIEGFVSYKLRVSKKYELSMTDYETFNSNYARRRTYS